MRSNVAGNRSQRSRWIVLLFVAGFVALTTLGMAASPIPGLAARAWAVRGTPMKADAIVVLGGGARWPGVLQCGSVMRLQQGIWLYKQGYASRLVLSGGRDPAAQVPAEAKLMRELALRMGVEPSAIFVDVRSSRTYENGTEVAALMRREGWRSALLVTDAIHMRRARLVFERLGIKSYPVPSHTVGIGSNTPSQGLAIMERIVYELVATVVYKLRGWA